MKAIRITIEVKESTYNKWWGVEKYGVNQTMNELTSEIETLLIKNEVIGGFSIQSTIVTHEEGID